MEFLKFAPKEWNELKNLKLFNLRFHGKNFSAGREISVVIPTSIFEKVETLDLFFLGIDKDFQNCKVF